MRLRSRNTSAARRSAVIAACLTLAAVIAALAASAASALTAPATSTTLTLSTMSPVAGQPLTLTATVTGVGGAPTGTVKFVQNNSDGTSSTIGPEAGVVVATTSDTTSEATVDASSLTPGTYTLTATYRPDQDFGPFRSSQSPAVLITVSPDHVPVYDTAVALTAVPGALEGTLNLTAVVSRSPAGGVPTGNVLFYSNGVLLGQAVLDAGGTAGFLASGFTPGTYVVTTSYMGDESDRTSASLPQTVTFVGQSPPISTTTTVTSQPARIAAGLPVLLTAHVTQDGAATPPAGTVLFYGNGVLLGHSSLDENGDAVLQVAGWIPGNYTISASYLGSTTANLAASSGATPLKVTDGIPVLHVAAPSATIEYAGSMPTLSPSYSGFIEDDTIGSLTQPATCTATAPSAPAPAADWPVTCSGAASPNYTFSYTAGTLTVTKAPLTVTANNTAMVAGQPVPALTTTITGFKNGETPATVSGSAACTTTATAASPIGTYPITCTRGTLDAANYTFTTFAAGTLTIKPQLTITGSSATVAYGSAIPALTPLYSGFVGGDTEASLTTRPTCTTAATSTSPVGSYPVTCSGAASSKYAFVYVNGVLTIGPAPLTVTANNATIVIGQPIPALTTTISGFKNGETLTTAGVNGSAACTTTATAASPAGTYPITCTLGSLTATNYTFATFSGGTLTILPPVPPMVCVRPADEHASDNRGKGSVCEELLSHPTAGSGGKVSAGDTMSIVYADDTPMATSPLLRPSVVLLNGPVLLPVTVTSTSQGKSRYQSVISFSVPTGLTPGTYSILVTVHDSDGHLDQWMWDVRIDKASKNDKNDK
jgi:hypothetical protein